MKQMWIFRVSGGEPFELTPKGNLPMRYEGQAETLLRCLCTQLEATVLENHMRSYGCEVEAHSPQETAEQKERRTNIMHALGGDRVFPCVRCPECAWFDPEIESLCGAGFSQKGPGWKPEAIEGVMTNPKYAADFQACPIKNRAIQ